MAGALRHLCGFRNVKLICLIVGAVPALLLFCRPTTHAAGIITNCTSADLSAALIGGGLVTFGCDGTIYLTNTITITNDTTFDASGRTNVIISGLIGGITPGAAVRVLNISTGVNFTLVNLTIANGSSTSGGAIFNNGGRVSATNCIFSGNHAIGPGGLAGANGRDRSDAGGDGEHGEDGGPALGGAIFNLGELFLSRCLFLTNSATGGDGGAGGDGGDGDTRGGDGANGGKGGSGYGGAIYNVGAVSVANCTFDGNAATGGGGGEGGVHGEGFFNGFSGGGGPGATGAGAGLYCAGQSFVANSTFSNNSVHGGDSTTAGQANNGDGIDGRSGGEGLGGGICNLGSNTTINCTFFANSVTGGAGGNGGDGGLAGDGGNGGSAWGGGFYNAGTAVVDFSTFSSGSATGGVEGAAGEGRFEGDNGHSGAKKGGNVARESGTFTLQNSLVAYGVSGKDGSGNIVDGGHNISSDGSLDFSASSSLKNTDPRLGPLADNGGFTLTIALLAGSPAINAADSSDCPPFDQRGKPRPFGSGCDIGAFEYEPTFTIRGRITEGTNGMSGIMVTAGTRSGTSDTNGNYLISNLVSNSYTVTPQSLGVGFNPVNRDVTLGPDATNINFALNPVQITSATLTTNSSLRLSFLGGPGRTYRVEVSTNLAAWQTLATNIAATNGAFEFIDNRTNTFPVRFYRTATP